MTNDLISREPVIEWLKTAGHFLKVWHGRKNNDTLKVIGAIINHIEAEPAVDAVEVVHAKWEHIPIFNGLGRYRCGRCFHYINVGADKNYCPNCGARMDGDGNG